MTISETEIRRALEKLDSRWIAQELTAGSAEDNAKALLELAMRSGQLFCLHYLRVTLSKIKLNLKA